MTDDEIRELATEMILDHARDIEWLTINECLPEGLSDADADAAAKKVDNLIVKATITVELPGGEAPTSGLYDHILTEITEADPDSPSEAASAAYNAVLPVLANLDIQVQQLTEQAEASARTDNATHDALNGALDSIKAQDITGAAETLTDLLESLGGTR